MTQKQPDEPLKDTPAARRAAADALVNDGRNRYAFTPTKLHHPKCGGRIYSVRLVGRRTPHARACLTCFTITEKQLELD